MGAVSRTRGLAGKFDQLVAQRSRGNEVGLHRGNGSAGPELLRDGLVELIVRRHGGRRGVNSPAPVPGTILTPDRVETRIGPLEFTDGFPSDETAAKVFDHLDFLRAVEVFLQGVPAASMEGLRAGLAGIGCDAAHMIALADRLLDSNPLFLTGNTDTVYALAMLDLDRDGPTVVEIPPGCGPGTVNDAWFRFVTDMGAPGPDRGAGGDYLLVPPGYDGEIPDGYHVAHSSSCTNLLALRGFLVDGKTDAATAMFEDGVTIYPLSAANERPEMEFLSVSGKACNTIHANDQAFYDELADVIRREPIEMIDPETRGLLASIGIHKDRPFEPDERMRATLTDAAAVGNATARAICFQTRDPRAYYYDEGRTWKTGFVGGDYRWLDGDGRGGRNLDARTLFFYQATLNTRPWRSRWWVSVPSTRSPRRTPPVPTCTATTRID